MRIALLFVIATMVWGQDLPEGKGKELTARVCSGCHGMESIVRAKRTKERWAETVDDMVSRGAKGTDEEFDQIVEYLTANFGPKQEKPKSQR